MEDFEEKVLMDQVRGEVNREIFAMMSQQLSWFQSKIRSLQEMHKTIVFFKAMKAVLTQFRVNFEEAA